MASAMGVSQFGFEGPAIGTEINEFGRVVLAGSRYEPDADTKNGLLSPFSEFGHIHGTTTDQVHRKSKSGRQEARTISKCFRANDGASEVTNAIG
jgi:hypothetical protein